MGFTNTNSKPKLKPARMITKEKVQEVKDKMADISSTVVSSQTVSAHPAEPSEQVDDADVIVPVCQSGSESPEMPESAPVEVKFSDRLLNDITVEDYCFLFETLFNACSDNREEAKRKAREESRRKQEASGIDVITPENALVKCTGFMNDILTGYNLYKKHESAIDKQQTKSKEISDTQNETVKRLETVIGRIEDVQGVKAPKRPPFPSWACLAFLFWHWPMYGFAYLWQSKYFRRFCFLIAFFVMVLEFCMIILLSYDNKDLHHDRAKYVTVRNWSLSEGDTATINKFDYVDFIYSDAKYRKDDIDALQETIRKKYDIMMEKKQKQQRQKRRK